MVIFSPLLCFSVALTAFLVSVDARIDPELRTTLATHPTANVFVEMKEGTDHARRLAVKSINATRGENIAALRNSLKSHAQVSQKSVYDQIASRPRTFNAEIRSLWITNELYIKGATLDMLEELNNLENVANIYEEDFLQLDDILEMGPIEPMNQDSRRVEWGIDAIRAPEVWDTGCRGKGVRIRSIDTGAFWNHDAFKKRYVGFQDIKYNDGCDDFDSGHDCFKFTRYAWYDPLDPKSYIPVDENGHGTHTIGTMVGGFGIGVAPEAEWMSCKGCGKSGCSRFALKACSQYMLCPHHPRDEDDFRCEDAPHIVSNSWGRGQGSRDFDPIINAWRDADIIPVFSAGNEGRGGCGTVKSPADNSKVIAVGAIDQSFHVADVSSRGPPMTDKTMIKPNVVAPGERIRSAWPSDKEKDRVRELTGTSMATPHVSGTIALILHDHPGTTFEELNEMISSTAMTSELNEDKYVCGSKNSLEFPNFVFGNGVADAYECLLQTRNHKH